VLALRGRGLRPPPLLVLTDDNQGPPSTSPSPSPSPPGGPDGIGAAPGGLGLEAGFGVLCMELGELRSRLFELPPPYEAPVTVAPHPLAPQAVRLLTELG
jgi:hypothetical protein